MKHVAALMILGLAGCSAASSESASAPAALGTSGKTSTKQLCSTEFKQINYDAAVEANAQLSALGVKSSDIAFKRTSLGTQVTNGLERTNYSYSLAINVGAVITRQLVAGYEVNDPNTTFADKQYPNQYTSCNFSSGYASAGYVVTKSSQVTSDEAKAICKSLKDAAAAEGNTLAIGALGQSGLYPNKTGITMDDTLAMKIGIKMDTDGTFSYPTLSSGSTEASGWSSVKSRCKSQLGTSDSNYPYLGYGSTAPAGTPELSVCLDPSSWWDWLSNTTPGILYVDVSSASLNVPLTIWKNKALATVTTEFVSDDGVPGVVNVKVPDIAVGSTAVSASIGSTCGWDQEADKWGDHAASTCTNLKSELEDEFRTQAKASMTTADQQALATKVESLVAGVMLELESAALAVDTSSKETIKLDSKATIKDINYNVDGWLIATYETTSCSSTSSSGTMPTTSHKCDADFVCPYSPTYSTDIVTDNQGCVHSCTGGSDVIIAY